MMAHKLSAADDDDRAVTPTIDATSAEPERLSYNADTSPRVGIRTAPPARIGRYVVLRPLGEGGMGVVYLAYDSDLDRKVAIKLVRGGSSGSRLARERVQKEAQTLAQVSHPNIVHVYEVGQSGSEVFIAMEYVPGISLRQFQRPPAGMPPPSIEKVLRVYLQAATGLYAAHRRGLIHRDLMSASRIVDSFSAPARSSGKNLAQTTFLRLAQRHRCRDMFHRRCLCSGYGCQSRALQDVGHGAAPRELCLDRSRTDPPARAAR